MLPIRAILYTLTHNTEGLIAIQFLDGVANAIFGVVSILVVADRTRATGRFNLVQGALATAVGLGAALSTSFGGKLIQYYSYRISFLALGAIAVLAFVLLWFAVPETLPAGDQPDSDPASPVLTRSFQREWQEVVVMVHFLLPLMVAVSIGLMLARPYGIAEVWWILGEPCC